MSLHNIKKKKKDREVAIHTGKYTKFNSDSDSDYNEGGSGSESEAQVTKKKSRKEGKINEGGSET